MKKTVIALSATLALAAPAFAEGCAWSKSRTAAAQEARYVGHHEEAADIVATAQAAGSFNTLLAAAEAAGLVEALQGDGPLTVFAPTDAAFEDLPEGTVDELLKPENKDQLAGTTTSADTLNGAVDIDGTDGVMVNDATVVTADVMASNGVIHVIDKVLMPAS